MRTDMPNEIYRSRLINDIRHAIAEAAAARLMNHPGLTGRIRELVASKILAPVLPAGFTFGTGKIVDSQNFQSDETDLVIYNRAVLPPVLYSERDGVFPVEACYYAIEVKSKVTAEAVRDAIRKGKSILELNAARKLANNRSNQGPVVLVLFAFDSDLSEQSSELERYIQHDPTWDTDPVLKAICVVGRGYWYHKQEENCWVASQGDSEHDEVIELVSGIVNTLLKHPASQRAALLGQYLVTPRPVTFRKRIDV